MFIQENYKFTENYDITDNYLNNIRVKPTVKSIYRFMASRPHKWRFKVGYLCKMECISSKTAYKYLNQLIQLGLIQRHQTKTDDGKFGDLKKMDKWAVKVFDEMLKLGIQPAELNQLN